MAKQSAIGALFFIDGYDLSGDVGVINNIKDSQALLNVTGIDKGAMERIPGLGDGAISFTAFFNDAAGAAHPVLKTKPATDRILTMAMDNTLGKAGVGMSGKQVDYPGQRGADGSIAFTVDAQSSDANGLRWGNMLTAGKRTDTAATNGSSVDEGAATAYGADLYLHVFSFVGTDVTVKIQDSANDAAWADLSGAAFTQITAGPTSQRIALGSTAAVRRYLRVATITTGGFTSLVFAVLACRRYG